MAILNLNQPVFYCVPVKAYEALMGKLEDAKLYKFGDPRLKDGKCLVKESLDELWAEFPLRSIGIVEKARCLCARGVACPRLFPVCNACLENLLCGCHEIGKPRSMITSGERYMIVSRT